MLGLRAYESASFIFSGDAAVDAKHTKYDPVKYFATGEAHHLPLRKGVAPATFKIKRLTMRQLVHVSDSRLTGIERTVETVAYGLVGWDNFGAAPAAFEEGPLGSRLTIEALDSIASPDFCGEAAVAILRLSKLVNNPLP